MGHCALVLFNWLDCLVYLKSTFKAGEVGVLYSTHLKFQKPGCWCSSVPVVQQLTSTKQSCKIVQTSTNQEVVVFNVSYGCGYHTKNVKIEDEKEKPDTSIQESKKKRLEESSSSREFLCSN